MGCSTFNILLVKTKIEFERKVYNKNGNKKIHLSSGLSELVYLESQNYIFLVALGSNIVISCWNFRTVQMIIMRCLAIGQTLWEIESVRSDSVLKWKNNTTELKELVTYLTRVESQLESDIRVKSYDHLNSRELPLFNFERLDILCTLIRHPSEKLWPFEFVEIFHCSILSVSIYYALQSEIRLKSSNHLSLSRASVVNFEHLDILYPRIWHPCEKLWLLEFSGASVDLFRASRYIMRQNQTSLWKVMTIWVLESFRCSISSVSIYYAP